MICLRETEKGYVRFIITVTFPLEETDCDQCSAHH